MNKQAISNALKALQKTVKKHSPEILTGIGIAGMTAAAVMAVKATPRPCGWWTKRKSETESA
ncbi:MAG: DUF6353 family protein [Flavonifractor plautii]